MFGKIDCHRPNASEIRAKGGGRLRLSDVIAVGKSDNCGGEEFGDSFVAIHQDQQAAGELAAGGFDFNDLESGFFSHDKNGKFFHRF
jgi:hypothetical protein